MININEYYNYSKIQLYYNESVIIKQVKYICNDENELLRDLCLLTNSNDNIYMMYVIIYRCITNGMNYFDNLRNVISLTLSDDGIYENNTSYVNIISNYILKIIFNSPIYNKSICDNDSFYRMYALKILFILNINNIDNVLKQYVSKTYNHKCDVLLTNINYILSLLITYELNDNRFESMFEVFNCLKLISNYEIGVLIRLMNTINDNRSKYTIMIHKKCMYYINQIFELREYEYSDGDFNSIFRYDGKTIYNLNSKLKYNILDIVDKTELCKSISNTLDNTVERLLHKYIPNAMYKNNDIIIHSFVRFLVKNIKKSELLSIINERIALIDMLDHHANANEHTALIDTISNHADIDIRFVNLLNEIDTIIANDEMIDEITCVDKQLNMIRLLKSLTNELI